MCTGYCCAAQCRQTNSLENHCPQGTTQGSRRKVSPEISLSYRSFLEAEHAGRSAIPPPRLIYTNFYFKSSPNFHEALVDTTTGQVLWQRDLGSKIHAPGTPEEIERMHDIAMKSDLVKKEIDRLRLIEGTEVVCEPWPYGKDGINDDERLFQVVPAYDHAKFSATSSLLQSILARSIHHSTITRTLLTFPALSTEIAKKSSASSASLLPVTSSPVQRMTMSTSPSPIKSMPQKCSHLSVKTSNLSISLNHKA